MKKLFSFFLILALLLTFAGCRALDRAEDAVENKVDAAEDAIEQTINDAANALLNPYPNAPAESHTPVDPSQLITAEHAQDIAILHAGVDQAEVSGLHTVLDIDDGRQEYDVEFRVGHLEYEYEIDAATGKILSWDKDD